MIVPIGKEEEVPKTRKNIQETVEEKTGRGKLSLPVLAGQSDLHWRNLRVAHNLLLAHLCYNQTYNNSSTQLGQKKREKAIAEANQKRLYQGGRRASTNVDGNICVCGVPGN